jgi:HSP20 family protein
MLMRFDPFREFDRLVDQVWNGLPRLAALPMDAYRQDDHLVVRFDMPGVDPDSVELTVEKNMLTVSAERTWQPERSAEVLASERAHGTFTRQLLLGESLDLDHIEASYDNGVLTVNIPVAKEAKPRKVEITSGAGQPKAIAAMAQAA